MGVPILVLGESGTGKSTSLRNFKKDEIAIVNVAGKPLPFKGSFENISGTVDCRKISQFMKSTKSKSIVVDDAQYIMSFQYMRRIKENGWDKFNELQSDFFNLIDLVKDLPSDVVVYFMSHLETKEDGRQKIKTIGKMLDEKITIEGMFTVVLKTYTADGKYYFLTQNSGSDTTKSPMGMFPSYAIDNDLKYVDDKIRNYYELGEYLSDEEMAEIDAAAKKVDVIKDEVEGKKRRSARGKKDENAKENTGTTEAESETAEKEEQSVDDGISSEATESTGRRRRRANANADNTRDDAYNESCGDNTTEDSADNEEKSETESADNNGTGRRRRRSVADSMADERAAVEQENTKNIVNAGMEEAGDAEEVPFEEVNEPELTNLPRRKRRGADAEADKSISENNAEGSQSGAPVHEQSNGVMNPQAEEAPRRRRRRE